MDQSSSLKDKKYAFQIAGSTLQMTNKSSIKNKDTACSDPTQQRDEWDGNDACKYYGAKALKKV